ncbi:MAG: hypothetical protein WDM79_17330 [Terricaulis sp.]
MSGAAIWSPMRANALGWRGVMNVFAHVADGAEGWAEDAPYDRIILNASVDAVPPCLAGATEAGWRAAGGGG